VRSVEDIRIDIRTVGPRDDSQFIVYGHGFEDGAIATYGLEDRPTQEALDVDDAIRTVRERRSIHLIRNWCRMKTRHVGNAVLSAICPDEM